MMTGANPFTDRPRYQHGFSARSGNDGKQPARSEQTGHETGPVNSRKPGPHPGYTIGISGGRGGAWPTERPAR
jgi:hypothetical protein